MKNLLSKIFQGTRKHICTKQDIPEVQAVIRMLKAQVEAEMDRVREQILARLKVALSEYTDDLQMPDVDALVMADDGDKDELLLAILASLMFVFDQQVSAPVRERLRSLIQAAADDLVAEGARSLGLTLNVTNETMIRLAAAAELEALIRYSFRQHRDRIEDLMESWLTNRAARTELGALDEALPPLEAGQAPRSSQEFEEALVAILGLPTAIAVLDTWGYRWFNAGRFQAAVDGGFRAFQIVNNPPRGPDDRTTPFCRWVHGRTIPISRVIRQLSDQIQAALRGDEEALVRNWPYLKSTRGTVQQFQAYFAQAGLPPYHFGCRDVPEPVRI